jgi:hypothetical protein
VAVYFLAWPVWRAQFLVEIWPTESWNAYWQDAARRGEMIYPNPASLVGNNYPPLSFFAVATLGKLTGLDDLFVGRFLSLIAVPIIAVEIFGIVRLLTQKSVGAAVGALWYAAMMARNSVTYVGANDPQLAGLAIMGAGLLWFLSLCSKERSPVPAILVMVVAGFWKHNNVAIPLTGVTWLLITHNPYRYSAMMVGAATTFVGLTLCTVCFGGEFIRNLLADRSYGISNLLVNVGHLQWSAVALSIWLAWALGDRQSHAAKFTTLHVGIALSTCLLQWLGHGVSGNAEFDYLLAVAIGIGAAFGRLEHSWLATRVGSTLCRDLMVAALLLRLIATDRQETALLLVSHDFRRSLYDNEANLILQAQEVAAITGNVACKTKLICRTAGKPFTVDEFKVEEMILIGKTTANEIDDRMKSSRIVQFQERKPVTSNPNTSFTAWLRSKYSEDVRQD